MSLEIRLSEVKRLMGMGAKASDPHALDPRFEAFIALGRECVQVEEAFWQVGIEGSGAGRTRLEGGVSLRSPRLVRVLEKAHRVVVFAVTIGPRLEARVRRFKQRGDPFGAYVLDVVGSAAAEAAVERFHRRFDEDLEPRGLTTTLRFSPGYCDWDISEQRKVFAVLRERTGGVALLPSGVLSPRKSVTGVFGVVGAEQGAPGPINPCAACNLKACPTRRVGSPSPGSPHDPTSRRGAVSGPGAGPV